MRQVISFIRRLKVKSSLCFNFFPAFVLGLYLEDWKWGVIGWLGISLFMFYLGQLINAHARKQSTGIICKLCGFDGAVLLYPSRKKKTTTDIGDFACSSFDHGQYSDIYYCPSCMNGFLYLVTKSDFKFKAKKGVERYANVVDETYLQNIEARHLTNRRLVRKFSRYLQDCDVLEIGSYYAV